MWGINHLGHFYLTNLLAPSLFLNSNSKENEAILVPRVINVASLGEHMVDPDYNYYTNLIDAGLKELKFYPDKFREEFVGTDGYGFSKSCNILFTKELIKRYGKDKIISVSLQPGAVSGTDLIRDSDGATWGQILHVVNWALKSGAFSQAFMMKEAKDVPQGAATTVRCVSLKDNEISNGGFYHNCRLQNESVTGVASDQQDKNGQMAEKMWQLSKALLEAKGHSIGNV